ncbi:MAG: carboxypeptidase-like regulatory domain-containing protein [Gilvibacter sp.]
MKTRKTTAKRNVFKTLGFFSLCTILGLMANPTYGQEAERSIAGVVNSIDGPVSGATVILKGTSSYIVTDDQGQFTFPELLKEDDVLVISFLGYETAEVVIKEDTTFINSSLEDIPVVIIGALRVKDASVTTPEEKY